MTAIRNYYNQQSKGHLPGYYIGPAYQRGHGLGGIFSSLFRAAVPLFKMAKPVVKSGMKSLAKEALTTGANIATDLIEGENLQDSATRNLNKAAHKLVTKGANKLGSMVGNESNQGSRKRKKSIKGRRVVKRRKDIFD